MTAVETVDRAEERELLSGWLESTSFGREPAGIPPLQPEDDDE